MVNISVTSKMALQDRIAQLMSPSLPVLLLTIFLVLVVPVVIHRFVFRSSSSTNLPSFLLLGPNGAGKTSFLTLVSGLHSRSRFCDVD